MNTKHIYQLLRSVHETPTKLTQDEISGNPYLHVSGKDGNGNPEHLSIKMTELGKEVFRKLTSMKHPEKVFYYNWAEEK